MQLWKSKQRYKERLLRLQHLQLQQQTKREIQILQTSNQQLESHLQKVTLKHYGFRPNLRQSPFQNAVSLRSTSNPLDTPLYIPNLAFHDLTNQQLVPPYSRLVLGLGFIFIETPKYTNSDLSTTLSWLRCDIYLSTFFASSTNDDLTDRQSKLYVKSTRNPPLSDIPLQMDD